MATAANYTHGYDLETIKPLACGRWQEILTAVGRVPAEYLDGRNHPCPKCGGKDRFRFTNVDHHGSVVCSGGGSGCAKTGDGFASLQWLLGIDLNEAVRQVADYLGTPQNGQQLGTRVVPKKSAKPKSRYATVEDAIAFGEKMTSGEFVQSWPYTDDDHSVMWYMCRFNLPLQQGDSKPKKEYLPIVLDGAQWTIGGLPKLRPLYLDKSIIDHPSVAVPEGEGKADALWQIGIPAVASCGGSSAVRQTDWRPLAGKDAVTIFVDNDEAGEKFCQAVIAQLLQLKPPPTAIYTCRPEGLGPTEDVVDWMDQRESAEPDDLRQGLSELSVLLTPGSSFDWPDLTDVTEGLPPFPLDRLPDVLRKFVTQSAEEVQTPPDLQAFYCLSVVAAAIARKFNVAITESSWREPVNLYTVSVLDVGNRKSPGCKQCVAPLEEYEEEFAESQRDTVSQHNQKIDLLDKKRSALNNAIVKERDTQKQHQMEIEAGEIAKELGSLDERHVPSVFLDDCTTAALEHTLAHSYGRAAFLSPEGAVFDIMSGKYSKGQYDLDHFLRGHCGDTIRPKRISRKAKTIKEPAITFGLSVQPEKLRGVVTDEAFSGLGLLARFLYCVPPSTVGNRITRPKAADANVVAAYRELILSLARMPIPAEPALIYLSAEADELHDQFQKWLETQIGVGAPLSGMHDWPNKLAGHCLRLAAVLHFAKFRQDGPHNAIGADSMEDAIAICNPYLVEHATAAFMLASAKPGQSDADWILAWFRRKNQYGQVITARDVDRAGWRKFGGDVTRVLAALSILEHAGYVIALPQPERSGPGRTPSPPYVVRPIERM